MALTRDAVFWNAFTQHADCTQRAAQLLVEIISTPTEAERLWKQIDEIESQGDRITHEVVQALHKTWITPLDREEIHALITALDDVLDFIDATGERFGLYEVETTRKDALEMAKILVEQAKEMSRGVKALSNIKDGPALLEICDAMRRLERDCDKVYRRGVAALFKEKTEPLELMKWRDIFESLESSSDRIQDVADIIEGIVLEHA